MSGLLRDPVRGAVAVGCLDLVLAALFWLSLSRYLPHHDPAWRTPLAVAVALGLLTLPAYVVLRGRARAAALPPQEHP